MTISLNKVETQLVWRSADVGAKTTSVAGSDTTNKGYDLDISTTSGDGSTHIVTPISGTIDGVATFQFADHQCTLSLRSDGDNNDWIIRNFCCVLPTPLPPPPPPASALDFVNARARLNSTVSPTVPSRSFTITTTKPDVIILHIVINAESGSTPLVTGVFTSGLVWHRRASIPGTMHGIYLFGANSIVSETWYAVAATPGLFNITITTSSALAFLNATAVGINGIDMSSPIDGHSSLPARATNFGYPVQQTIQVSGVSTQNPNTMVLFILDDFDLAGLPVEVGWSTSGYELFHTAENLQAFIGLFVETGTSGKLFSAPLSSQTIVGRIAEPPDFTADHLTSGAWVITVDALKLA